jgi:hypothetical protein
MRTPPCFEALPVTSRLVTGVGAGVGTGVGTGVGAGVGVGAGDGDGEGVGFLVGEGDGNGLCEAVCVGVEASPPQETTKAARRTARIKVRTIKW